MELRKPIGNVQKFAEATLRFRLILLPLLVVAILALSHGATQVEHWFWNDAKEVESTITWIFASLHTGAKYLAYMAMMLTILLVIRFKFAGIRNTLFLLLASIIFPLSTIVLLAHTAILPVIVALALVIAVSAMFFGRSYWATGLLPLTFGYYALLSVGERLEVPGLAIVSMILLTADWALQVQWVSQRMRENSVSKSAVAWGIQRSFLLSVVSAMALSIFSLIYSYAHGLWGNWASIWILWIYLAVSLLLVPLTHSFLLFSKTKKQK